MKDHAVSGVARLSKLEKYQGMHAKVCPNRATMWCRISRIDRSANNYDKPIRNPVFSENFQMKKRNPHADKDNASALYTPKRIRSDPKATRSLPSANYLAWGVKLPFSWLLATAEGSDSEPIKLTIPRFCDSSIALSKGDSPKELP